MKITVRYRHCNSENVSLDAWADWNVEAQQWVLGTTFDYAHCHKCEGETRLMEVPLDAVPA